VSRRYKPAKPTPIKPEIKVVGSGVCGPTSPPEGGGGSLSTWRIGPPSVVVFVVRSGGKSAGLKKTMTATAACVSCSSCDRRSAGTSDEFISPHSDVPNGMYSALSDCGKHVIAGGKDSTIASARAAPADVVNSAAAATA